MRSRAVRREWACCLSMAFGSASFADLLLFVANLGDEFRERAHVGFEAERGRINLGREDIVDGDGRGFDTFRHESEA